MSTLLLESPELTQDSVQESCISIRDLDFNYGTKTVLRNINLELPKNQITAFIGPSGCGKSTLLRCLNRINDRIESAHISNGYIHVNGKNIYDPDVDLTVLRRKVGMVFQKYTPFPKSIFENVVYGLRVAGVHQKKILQESCEQALRITALWDEVKDRLNQNAFSLSGGQMQRLCIARAIAVKPDILLMDEPCSALDPIATLKIEELMHQLREHYTLVIVTHNMQQARRVADKTAFLFMGEVVEFDNTYKLFTTPSSRKTLQYIQGLFS